MIARELLYDALLQLCGRIEACGASPELTRAVVLASALARAVGNPRNPPGEFALDHLLIEMGLKKDPRFCMCPNCRTRFTEEEISGATKCPKCSNKGVPADANKTAMLTLTTHEWRVLFMWATRWAEEYCAKHDRPGYDSPGLMRSLRAEARRQVPQLPPLSLQEEVGEIAQVLNAHTQLANENGEVIAEAVPQAKH